MLGNLFFQVKSLTSLSPSLPTWHLPQTLDLTCPASGTAWKTNSLPSLFGKTRMGSRGPLGQVLRICRAAIHGSDHVMDSAEKPMTASTGLSMNGKSAIISIALPFVLRLSKDERWVFQQNRYV
jgi:hypothetical protein